MTYTFKTIEPTYYGGHYYGIQTWTIEATSVQDAWNQVRQLTSVALTRS